MIKKISDNTVSNSGIENGTVTIDTIVVIANISAAYTESFS